MEGEFDPKIVELIREMCPGPPREAPICVYYRQADILDVICGDPPCNSYTNVYLGGMIFKGVDILRKSYPENVRNGDTFAGIQIWGGVQDFLSHHYQFLHGEKYGEFRARYNRKKQKTPVIEIVEALLKDPRDLALPRWEEWRERVMRALKEQKPAVHILLLPL